MKKIIKIILIILLFSLSSCELYKSWENHEIDKTMKERVSGHEIFWYDFGDFSDHESMDKTIYYIVQCVIRENVEAVETGEERIPGPKETWERGYGNCNGFSLLLANILFVEIGIKVSIVFSVLPEEEDTSSRTIVEGGYFNHTAIYYKGQVYEPQNGFPVDDYSICYIYDFNEIFIQ